MRSALLCGDVMAAMAAADAEEAEAEEDEKEENVGGGSGEKIVRSAIGVDGGDKARVSTEKDNEDGDDDDDEALRELFGCEWHHAEAHPIMNPEAHGVTAVFPSPHPSALAARGVYDSLQNRMPRASPAEVFGESSRPSRLSDARNHWVLEAIRRSFAAQMGRRVAGGVNVNLLMWRYGHLLGEAGSSSSGSGVVGGSTQQHNSADRVREVVRRIGAGRVPYVGLGPSAQQQLSVWEAVVRLQHDAHAMRNYSKHMRIVSENTNHAPGATSSDNAAVPIAPALFFTARQAELLSEVLRRTYLPRSIAAAPAAATLSAVIGGNKGLSVLVEPARSEAFGDGSPQRNRLLLLLLGASAADVLSEARHHHCAEGEEERSDRGSGHMHSSDTVAAHGVNTANTTAIKQIHRNDGGECRRGHPSSLPLRVPTPLELLRLSPTSPMLLHLFGNDALSAHHDGRADAAVGYAASASSDSFFTEGSGGIGGIGSPKGRARIVGTAAVLDREALGNPWPAMVQRRNSARGGGGGNSVGIGIGGAPFVERDRAPSSSSSAPNATSDATALQQLQKALAHQAEASLFNLWTVSELSAIASSLASSATPGAASNPSQYLNLGGLGTAGGGLGAGLRGVAAPSQSSASPSPSLLAGYPVVDALLRDRAHRNMLLRYHQMGAMADEHRRATTTQQKSKAKDVVTAAQQTPSGQAAPASGAKEKGDESFAAPFPFRARLPASVHKATPVGSLAVAMRNRLVRLGPSATPFFEDVLEEAMLSIHLGPQQKKNLTLIDANVGATNAINGSGVRSVGEGVPVPLLGILSHAPPALRSSHTDAVSGHWNSSALPDWLVLPATVNVAHCLDPPNMRIGPLMGRGSGYGKTMKKKNSNTNAHEKHLRPGDDLYQPRRSILFLGSSHARNQFTAICAQYVNSRELLGRRWRWRAAAQDSNSSERHSPAEVRAGWYGGDDDFTGSDSKESERHDETTEETTSKKKKKKSHHQRTMKYNAYSSRLHRLHELDSLCSPKSPEDSRFGVVPRRVLRATFPASDPHSGAPHEDASAHPFALAFYMQPFLHVTDVETVARLLIGRLDAMGLRRSEGEGDGTEANDAPNLKRALASADAVTVEMAQALPEFVATVARTAPRTPNSGAKNISLVVTNISDASRVPTTIPFAFSNFLLRLRPSDLRRLRGLFSHVVFVPGVWEASYFDTTAPDHAEGIAAALELIDEIFAPKEGIVMYNVHTHQSPPVADPTGAHHKTLDEAAPQFAGWQRPPPPPKPSHGGAVAADGKLDNDDNAARDTPSSVEAESGPAFAAELHTRLPTHCGHSHRHAKFRDAQLCAAGEATRRRVRDAWRKAFVAALSAPSSLSASHVRVVDDVFDDTDDDAPTSEESPCDIGAGAGRIGNAAPSSPPPQQQQRQLQRKRKRAAVAIADFMPPTAQSLGRLFVDSSGHHYTDVVLEAMSQRLLRDYICPPQFVIAKNKKKRKNEGDTKEESGRTSSEGAALGPHDARVIDGGHTHLFTTAGGSDGEGSVANHAASGLPAAYPFVATAPSTASSPASGLAPRRQRRRSATIWGDDDGFWDRVNAGDDPTKAAAADEDERNEGAEYRFLRVRTGPLSADEMPSLRLRSSTSAEGGSGSHQQWDEIHNLFPLLKRPMPIVSRGLCRAIFDHPLAAATYSDRAVAVRAHLFSAVPPAGSGATTAAASTVARRGVGGAGDDGISPMSGLRVATVSPYNPYVTSPLCSCLRGTVRLVSATNHASILDRSSSVRVTARGLGVRNTTSSPNDATGGGACGFVGNPIVRATLDAHKAAAANSAAALITSSSANGCPSPAQPLPRDNNDGLAAAMGTVRAALGEGLRGGSRWPPHRLNDAANASLSLQRSTVPLCPLRAALVSPLLTVTTHMPARYANDARYLLRTQSQTEAHETCDASLIDLEEGGGGPTPTNGAPPPPVEEAAFCPHLRSKLLHCGATVVEELRRRVNVYAYLYHSLLRDLET